MSQVNGSRCTIFFISIASPGHLTHVQVVSVGVNNITISWSAPHEPEGISLSGYYVMVQSISWQWSMQKLDILHHEWNSADFWVEPRNFVLFFGWLQLIVLAKAWRVSLSTYLHVSTKLYSAWLAIIINICFSNSFMCAIYIYIQWTWGYQTILN